MDFFDLLLSDIGPFGLLALICLTVMTVVLLLNKEFKSFRGILGIIWILFPLMFAGLTALDPLVARSGLVLEKHIEESFLSRDYAVYFREGEETIRVEVGQDEYFKVNVGQAAEFLVRKYHQGSLVKPSENPAQGAIKLGAPVIARSGEISSGGKAVSVQGQQFPGVLEGSLLAMNKEDLFIALVPQSGDLVPEWLPRGSKVLGQATLEEGTGRWHLVVGKIVTPDGKVLVSSKTDLTISETEDVGRSTQDLPSGTRVTFFVTE